MKKFILLGTTTAACGRRIRERRSESELESQALPARQTLPILFRDDFQDGNTDGWGISSAWEVNQEGDAYTFESDGEGSAWIGSVESPPDSCAVDVTTSVQ